MIAVQTVLGLVEPQSSGMGGGAFVVYYDARTGTTTTIDAREKAPALAREDQFVQFTLPGAGGFGSAAQSGLSVGVPGTPRMMEYVQNKFGKHKGHGHSNKTSLVGGADHRRDGNVSGR